MVFGQIGPRFRMLRRISTSEFFSVKKLEALQYLRRDQLVYHTIRQIFVVTVDKKNVNIGYTAFNTAINLLGNMIFGTDMSDPHSSVSEELRDSIGKLQELHAVTNLADSFPFLHWLDPQGIFRAFPVMQEFIQDL